MISEIRGVGTTSNAYSFTQVPDCGYDYDVSENGLPSFAVHNISDKTYSVNYVDDNNLVGNYQVSVTGTLTYYTDYTLNAQSSL